MRGELLLDRTAASSCQRTLRGSVAAAEDGLPIGDGEPDLDQTSSPQLEAKVVDVVPLSWPQRGEVVYYWRRRCCRHQGVRRDALVESAAGPAT